MADRLNRRGFIKHAAAVGGAVGLNGLCRAEPASKDLERLKPIGEAKGIHPGRVCVDTRSAGHRLESDRATGIGTTPAMPGRTAWTR